MLKECYFDKFLCLMQHCQHISQQVKRTHENEIIGIFIIKESNVWMHCTKRLKYNPVPLYQFTKGDVKNCTVLHLCGVGLGYIVVTNPPMETVWQKNCRNIKSTGKRCWSDIRFTWAGLQVQAKHMLEHFLQETKISILDCHHYCPINYFFLLHIPSS